MKKFSLIGRMMNTRKAIGPLSVASLGLLFVMLVLIPVAVQSADRLTVKDATGTTRFLVNDAGQVGFGTTNPQSTMQVTDTTTSGSRGLMSTQHNDGPNAGVIIMKKSRGSETTPTAVINGDYIGTIHAQAHDGTSYLSNVSTGSLSFLVDGTVTTGSIPTAISFQTGTTTANKAERLRITSSGNVGIGTSMPVYPLQMGSGAYVSVGGAWTNASSREYKENIKDLSTEEAAETLRELNPVKYNYKIDKEDKHVGFIAEDVPDLVATKDRKGLSPMDVVAVLTKVVQEQQKTISALSREVEGLKKGLGTRDQVLGTKDQEPGTGSQ